MNAELMTKIDDQITDWFARDPILESALVAAKQAGLPEINVSAALGKTLYLLTKMIGAKRAVEIGTLGGFSGTWIARGLASGGKLITVECEAKHAEIAKQTFAAAKVSDRVELKLGDAVALTAEGGELRSAGPFDLVFIDADKDNYPRYLDFALATVRPGGLILADNVIRSGSAFGFPSDETDAPGLLEYNRSVARDPRLEAIIIPAWRNAIDGLGIARVCD